MAHSQYITRPGSNGVIAPLRTRTDTGSYRHFAFQLVLLCLLLHLWAGTVLAESGLVGTATPAVIGNVRIVRNSVFNLSDPAEDKALYRFANKAHVTTRQHVVSQQLLFDVGEVYSRQALEESERILRSNRYIQNVSIVATPEQDGVVDIDVHTSDVWTLMPKISLSRSGGENNTGVGLKEMNLLGTGMAIEMLYKSDVDRSSRSIKFADQHFGDSWYSLNALYSNNSDGHARFLNVEKPFYALDSTNAHGMSLLDDDRIDSFFNAGQMVGDYRHEAKRAEIYYGFSRGLVDEWTQRYSVGLAFDEHRFSEVGQQDPDVFEMPTDRSLFYPFLSFELLQNKYEKATNIDQISRTEDRFLGTRIATRVGISSTALGSDREALLLDVAAQTGIGSSKNSSLLLAAALGGRLERGGFQDLLLDLSARFYKRQSDHRLFFASFGASLGRNLDKDHQILLGGDNGLRGYPLRYQVGDKRVLLTLEQRFFSDWYPFRLFRVGGAVFFDAGRAWGESAIGRQENEILRDVGFGLRIGNTRSGLGRMTHIDLAFPLDGDDSIKNVQLLIETRKSF